MAKRDGDTKTERVLVLYTGGTLGMVPEGSHPLAPTTAKKDLRRWIPELDECAEITVEIVTDIDSSLATPSLWLDLARRIAAAQEVHDVSGVVILHGTDTLAFTSSALSFLLPDLKMPVVLTGSQKPLAVTRTDARNNILGAVEAALFGPPEVMVFFRDKAYRGNRVTKTAIADFLAFSSPNFPSLGKAGIFWSWEEDLFWPMTRRPSIWKELPLEMPSAPLVLPWIPGFEFAPMIESLKGYWALLLEAFGTGNMPLSRETRQALRAFAEEGGLLMVRSQVPIGSTALHSYVPGQELADMGAIEMRDMTREAIVTKAMVLKALGFPKAKLAYAMTQSMAGEMHEGTAFPITSEHDLLIS